MNTPVPVRSVHNVILIHINGNLSKRGALKLMTVGNNVISGTSPLRNMHLECKQQDNNYNSKTIIMLFVLRWCSSCILLHYSVLFMPHFVDFFSVHLSFFCTFQCCSHHKVQFMSHAVALFNAVHVSFCCTFYCCSLLILLHFSGLFTSHSVALFSAVHVIFCCTFQCC